MGMVEVTVNGRTHTVQCDDGQEIRLKRLAQYVDGRVRELGGGNGSIGDLRLLVLTSLIIADELSDAYDEIKRLRTALAETSKTGEQRLTDELQRVAEQIERLAAACHLAEPPATP
ncbi:MAG TPA: cell division protein ZapA [Geminicoccus sp.]|jgi:cell division protein ZapA|uniref:cell division protein ZapA n=1 Tax=Geminicoccus sp. TaxID=2024832 RepID=UPI002E2EB360|nr:cell division protein ZapA [Geminicoccus sp.]HEX2524709.1 cell division protein ZapA [Geminicoccus sp.]